MDLNAIKRHATSMTPRKAFRPRGSLIVLTVLLILAALHFDRLCRFGDYIRQKNPFSGQKDVEQPFIATERELVCLNGRPLPDELSASKRDPIPNIVHFVFLQNPRAGTKEFDFLNYLAVRSAIVSLKPKSLQLHYAFTSEPSLRDPRSDPFNNPWIKRLQNDITLVSHNSSEISEQTQAAHAADIMRLNILQEQGGIYLDIDVFALRPFTNILNAPHPHDIVLGHEGGNRAGLCNAVIAARANSTFLERWIGTYQDADLSREWNYHSVILPKQMSGEHPDEICTLPPDSFFWPTWTWDHIEWMHQPLGRKEASIWRKEIKRTGGSLFDHQVAYHAWGQMGWDRYLKYLTPETIRTQDTRFNLLVRRFLEDDL